MRINHGRTAVRAHTVTDRLPATAWQRHSAGPGAKGPRRYDWPWIRIGTDSHRPLLIRRNRTTRELAFCLCWSPTEVPLAVRVAGVCWSVEECFQAAKSQVGLDHYLVRNWTLWHRHIILVMLALAFLTALAADAAPQRPVDRLHPTRGSHPITLTVPEIRHLLVVAFIPPVVTAARMLHWSHRRRRHQATAQRSHCRRRSAGEPAGWITKPHWSTSHCRIRIFRAEDSSHSL
ncbi:hypothetical protein [Streptomyces sp. NPDC059176]|uniref:hypothetical protein n=1 Tax=Streptomyces sp. NPDC059176 TaxID=3346758 RepID=UPI0036937329